MSRRLSIPVRQASWFLGIFILTSSDARAQSSASVLLVVNDLSTNSLQVGEYYARKRAIAADNIVHLSATTSETITRSAYEQQIEAPIATWFVRSRAHDRILYIVLTKGVPLRIDGTDGRSGTVASVDSELTLLYRKLSGEAVTSVGRVDNPYFLGERPLADAMPFTHASYDIFLVTRLDGFTVDDVFKLIDNGSGSATSGHVVLQPGNSGSPVTAAGNAWLAAATERLKGTNLRPIVPIDPSTNRATADTVVMGYASWGWNDPAIRASGVKARFAPGALATMFSADPLTFVGPLAEGRRSDGILPSGAAAARGSLVGELIRDGVSGVAGYVADPFLPATIRPQILFPAYAAGRNLAEAFYLSSPYLSWQLIVLGDPLCAPFGKGTMAATQTDLGIDAATELPPLFAARRLRARSKLNVATLTFDPEPALSFWVEGPFNVQAVKLAVLGESRMSRNDRAGAIAALEQATALEPRLAIDQFRLGNLYSAGGEFEKAVERYRRSLDVAPIELASLNNLAWVLAVHQHQVEEGLTLAQRAYELIKTFPVWATSGAGGFGFESPFDVVDTLGWIRVLRGDYHEAIGILEEAVMGNPQNATYQIHAAAAYAAVNRREDAARALKRAFELDPQVTMEPESARLLSHVTPTP